MIEPRPHLSTYIFYFEVEVLQIEAGAISNRMPARFGVCYDRHRANPPLPSPFRDADADTTFDKSFESVWQHREHYGSLGMKSFWAVDGSRQQKWRSNRFDSNGIWEDFGSTWAAGDVIGFELDMRTRGPHTLRVSVNGSFDAPNGVAFADIDAPELEPFAAGEGGRYRVNWDDRPFAHAPLGIQMEMNGGSEGEQCVSVAFWCSI